MDNVIIVKYSEIGLKGKNRVYFENFLVNNIRLKSGFDKIRKTHGRIYIEPGNCINTDCIQQAIERLAKTFGITSVCSGLKVVNDKKEIEKAALLLFEKEEEKKNPETFKINTRRINKRFPEGSYEISSYLGETILKKFPNIKVNLSNPDVTINVEIREKTYIYAEELRGPGGLPVPSSGKGLLLLSGGIDSPVAGYLMGKRGLQVDAIYYHSPPYVSEKTRDKIRTIAEVLCEYFGQIIVYTVPFTEVQKIIQENANPRETTLHTRAAMIAIADRIAKSEGYNSIITGESLGQVASQTSESMRFTQSYTDLPIFRPLVGMNKEEIKDIARMIGTYDISILPYEDCCTLFTPKHPIIKPNFEIIKNNFSRLPIEKPIDTAVLNTEKEIFKLSEL
ncbi:MAG TPA: tRNA 4-thiouridine(8) synthase ThiI, partial [Candidatus Omnitrophica bacterium]|nr:tRNA 4-thiouridine(8) synthase ThiI [Candidatus Omnitrophota bacterium]